MSVALFVLGKGSSMPAVAHTVTPASASGVGLSIISVLWAYEGWQYVTFISAEAKDPQKSLPRAIAYGTLLLIAIYLIANFAYLAALGPARCGGVGAGGRRGHRNRDGARGRWLIAAAIIVSMYSAAHATVITVPRVYFAMARDGLFFQRLTEVHPTFGTPAIAIITSCTWALVLALTGTFEQLLTYVVFIGWIFYAMGAAAVIALRIKRPDAVRPFRVPGYPVTPLLFVLAAVVIVGNTVWSQPKQALIGIAVVMAGAPAYVVWQRRLKARAS